MSNLRHIRSNFCHSNRANKRKKPWKAPQVSLRSHTNYLNCPKKTENLCVIIFWNIISDEPELAPVLYVFLFLYFLLISLIFVQFFFCCCCCSSSHFQLLLVFVVAAVLLGDCFLTSETLSFLNVVIMCSFLFLLLSVFFFVENFFISFLKLLRLFTKSVSFS